MQIVAIEIELGSLWDSIVRMMMTDIIIVKCVVVKVMSFLGQ